VSAVDDPVPQPITASSRHIAASHHFRHAPGSL